MADTRIALDYLTDLFAKLAAGDLDPARVDWPFAAEAWQAVRGEVERLRTEAEHHRQDKELLAEELSEASICVERMSTPQRALIERWRRETEELESRAVRHYDVACLSDGDRCTEKAKELRVRAAEVERAIGGGHANFESGGGK